MGNLVVCPANIFQGLQTSWPDTAVFSGIHLVANSACYTDHCCKRLKVKRHFWESRGWDNKKLIFPSPAFPMQSLSVGWRSDRPGQFSGLVCGQHVRAATERRCLLIHQNWGLVKSQDKEEDFHPGNSIHWVDDVF